MEVDLSLAEADDLDVVAEESGVLVEVLSGELTQEQRAAYHRFMDWYKAKIVNDVAMRAE